MTLLESWAIQNGFASTPVRVLSTGSEKLCRVWGGSSAQLGRFFTPMVLDGDTLRVVAQRFPSHSLGRPASVLEAELRSNIVLWGNQCAAIATFRMRPNVLMWIGEVEHGESDLSLPGLQVWLEYPDASVTLVSNEVLKQDRTVSSRAGHA